MTAPDGDGHHDASSPTYAEAELYDLRGDPYELTNLIGLPSHQDVAAALRQRLTRRMVEAGEDQPAILTAPERPAEGQRRVSPREAFD